MALTTIITAAKADMKDILSRFEAITPLNAEDIARDLHKLTPAQYNKFLDMVEASHAKAKPAKERLFLMKKVFDWIDEWDAGEEPVFDTPTPIDEHSRFKTPRVKTPKGEIGPPTPPKSQVVLRKSRRSSRP